MCVCASVYKDKSHVMKEAVRERCCVYGGCECIKEVEKRNLKMLGERGWKNASWGSCCFFIC